MDKSRHQRHANIPNCDTRFPRSVGQDRDRPAALRAIVKAIPRYCPWNPRPERRGRSGGADSIPQRSTEQDPLLALPAHGRSLSIRQVVISKGFNVGATAKSAIRSVAVWAIVVAFLAGGIAIGETVVSIHPFDAFPLTNVGCVTLVQQQSCVKCSSGSEPNLLTATLVQLNNMRPSETVTVWRLLGTELKQKQLLESVLRKYMDGTVRKSNTDAVIIVTQSGLTLRPFRTATPPGLLLVGDDAFQLGSVIRTAAGPFILQQLYTSRLPFMTNFTFYNHNLESLRATTLCLYPTLRGILTSTKLDYTELSAQVKTPLTLPFLYQSRPLRCVKTYICAHAQEINADNNDENIHQKANPSSNAAFAIVARTQVGFAHAQVRHAPEDPAEEAVEERTHERQQIGEEGDDLGDDEGDRPCHGQNSGPGNPANHSVRGLVNSTLKQSEEDKSSRDRGIQDAEEDQGRHHEREGHLLVNVVAERSKRRCSVVLCSSVAVDWCEETVSMCPVVPVFNGNKPNGLAEIIRVLHLGDEAGKSDLANECVTDVQEGVHAGNERGAGQRNGQDQRLAPDLLARRVDVVGIRVVACGPMLAFSARKCRSKDDTNESKHGCERGQFRESIEGARHGADPRHDGANGGEADGGTCTRHLLSRDGADRTPCKYIISVEFTLVENECRLDHDKCTRRRAARLSVRRVVSIVDGLANVMQTTLLPGTSSIFDGIVSLQFDQFAVVVDSRIRVVVKRSQSLRRRPDSAHFATMDAGDGAAPSLEGASGFSRTSTMFCRVDDNGNHSPKLPWVGCEEQVGQEPGTRNRWSRKDVGRKRSIQRSSERQWTPWDLSVGTQHWKAFVLQLCGRTARAETSNTSLALHRCQASLNSADSLPSVGFELYCSIESIGTDVEASCASEVVTAAIVRNMMRYCYRNLHWPPTRGEECQFAEDFGSDVKLSGTRSLHPPPGAGDSGTNRDKPGAATHPLMKFSGQPQATPQWHHLQQENSMKPVVVNNKAVVFRRQMLAKSAMQRSPRRWIACFPRTMSSPLTFRVCGSLRVLRYTSTRLSVYNVPRYVWLIPFGAGGSSSVA
ncbi:hypothetical protein KCU88_g5, partial [Aureobasidium melanogenum]